MGARDRGVEIVIPPFAPPAPLLWTIALPACLAALARALGLVRWSAVLAGAPLGMVVMHLGGIGGFGVLLGFFMLGTLLTRMGYAVKDARGVAEGSGGRRGAAHVAANCTAGLMLLGLRQVMVRAGVGPDGERLLWAAYVGSFAAAVSDTASSEVGQLWGRRPVSIRSLRPVPIGTEGAVSLEGLAGGLAAAALLAIVGGGLRLLDGTAIVAVACGGFAGNLLESMAGGWGRRILPHGALNFANTVVGACLAALLAALL